MNFGCPQSKDEREMKGNVVYWELHSYRNSKWSNTMYKWHSAHSSHLILLAVINFNFSPIVNADRERKLMFRQTAEESRTLSPIAFISNCQDFFFATAHIFSFQVLFYNVVDFIEASKGKMKIDFAISWRFGFTYDPFYLYT